MKLEFELTRKQVEAFNNITFTLPLMLSLVLLSVHFWLENDSAAGVRIKDLSRAFDVGGVSVFAFAVASYITLLTGGWGRRLYHIIVAGICGGAGLVALIWLGVIAVGYRERIRGADRWQPIIVYLAPSIGCDHLKQKYLTSQQLFSANLDPLQTGCCMPPSKCGLYFVSPTHWTTFTRNQTYDDPDCTMWNNHPTKLCYNCHACKEGLFANIGKKGRKAFFFLLAANVLLIFVAIYNLWGSKIIKEM